MKSDNSEEISISIVIPFYNVKEELLRRCLNSIFDSTFQNFEIIIVNDGSDSLYTDILKNTALKYGKVKIFNLNNGGVSKARNEGITFCNGKYIIYVDADDAVTPYFLEQAHKIISENGSDMVIGGCLSVPYDWNYSELKSNKIENVRTYTQSEFSAIRNSFIINPIRNGETYLGPGCWARILKKDIAQKIAFPEGIKISEDVIWNQKIFNVAEKITLVETAWYYHYVNLESVTHRYCEENINIIRDEFIELLKYVDLKDDNTYKCIIQRLYGETHWHVCQNYLTNSKCPLDFGKRNHIFYETLNSYPWNIIKFRFFRLSNLEWKIKYILFRTHLIFLFFNIVDRRREKRGIDLT